MNQFDTSIWKILSPSQDEWVLPVSPSPSKSMYPHLACVAGTWPRMRDFLNCLTCQNGLLHKKEMFSLFYIK